MTGLPWQMSGLIVMRDSNEFMRNQRSVERQHCKGDCGQSFIDLAPTFIEVAGLKWSETWMAELSGCSLTDIFRSDKSDLVNPARDHVLIGKERTDVGLPHDWGYPTRGIENRNREVRSELVELAR